MAAVQLTVVPVAVMVDAKAADRTYILEDTVLHIPYFVLLLCVPYSVFVLNRIREGHFPILPILVQCFSLALP